ncbi:MAG: carboxylate-amine ligase [Acidimicrobiaceae bacterium]|nr:carboxylate-amine ligase [Acidimicrobiaceae bacterium]MXZ98035.1 carboxylate-amine ligase [Acidimicrobiaceae bacterium]MYE75761.1 carboxylate-amine ligase [Acidimicrobiaceae bacterium]MYE96366.1 carboxylate-amine ligase [Acidimicrobiaceae bacterium]MYI53250.1 carboxylate-amine ligase [Acidimicrobiaceae bacterium]
MDEPAWTMGVEEEYLLVHRETGALITKQPPGVLETVSNVRHGLVARELFDSQIEIGTDVCSNLKELRADVWVLRQAVADAAAEYGMAPIAASSHPFARWHQQQYTDKERYQAIAADLQGVIRRLVISGMHVHVGIEDQELRIDLMEQASYFLPHLLALSTSSPFWEARNTGLRSYRMAVGEAIPRSGIPEKFGSWSEFRRHIDVLVRAGIIEDSTMVWWYIRPSERYPTLEMRVTDLPTRMEDSVAIAAMYVCLLRMLWRLRLENRRWRSYANFLLSENLWRAQRYGVGGELMDFGKGVLVPFGDLLEELIEMVLPDAEALDCVAEIEHTRTICRRGTSADRQLATYHGALEEGATEDEALKAVVDVLVADTVAPAEF